MTFVVATALGVAIAQLAPPALAWGGEATGGTQGPQAEINVTGVGGSGAPVGEGTGGSEYGFALHAPHARHSPARRPAHVRLAPKPARKPSSKPSPRKPPSKSPKPPTKPASTPTAPPVGELPAGVPTLAQTVADGAVFPVRGGPHSYGGPENRFGAPRSGHTHQGQDILAAEGLSDVAPLAGSIIATGNQPGGAGWYVAEHTQVGFDLFFAHCETGSVRVSAGQTVTPGAELCKLGSTGDATAPHLHFEMWVGGWHAKGGHPIDPLPYLEAWEGQ